MSYTEYLGWQAYFRERPVGWREDNRVMPLLQIKGLKAKPHEIFPSLIPIHSPTIRVNEKAAEVPLVSSTNLKRSMLFSMMTNSTNGDKLNLE